MIREVAIIGLGLIGGSLGKALKIKNPDLRIVGIDVKTEIIDLAKELKIIDEGTTSLEKGVRNAELIFIAVPVQVIPEICRRMIPNLQKDVIITDVCSTKEYVITLMEEHLPGTAYFVGGHPMAGSEKWGLEGVDELLFENAAYILTPNKKTNDQALEIVKRTVESLGARVVFLSPEEHDRKVAAVSHLPHIIAGSLMNTVGRLENEKAGYFPLAAGGLRDTTRIAASNSELWCGILLQNEKAILPLIKEFKKSLSQFERAINKQRPKTLKKLLLQARLWRCQLPTGMKSILPQMFELNVTVPDKPGMIGEISSLLGQHAINIIDIEVQRVREGEEGAIRLGFLEEESVPKALRILEDNGFKARESKV